LNASQSDYRNEALALLQAMNAGSAQNWNAQWMIYDLVISRWSESLTRRVVQHAALTCEWRPSPAKLREIAATLESPFPSADLALDEMLTLLRRFGSNAAPHPKFPNRPNILGPGAPTFTHPLIAAAIRRLGGWETICDGEAQYQEGGLQGAFRAVYDRAAEEWKGKVIECLDNGTRPPSLFPDYRPFIAGSIESISGASASESSPRKQIAPAPRLVPPPPAFRELLDSFANRRAMPPMSSAQAQEGGAA